MNYELISWIVLIFRRSTDNNVAAAPEVEPELEHLCRNFDTNSQLCGEKEYEGEEVENFESHQSQKARQTSSFD